MPSFPSVAGVAIVASFWATAASMAMAAFWVLAAGGLICVASRALFPVAVSVCIVGDGSRNAPCISASTSFLAQRVSGVLRGLSRLVVWILPDAIILSIDRLEHCRTAAAWSLVIQSLASGRVITLAVILS